MMKFRDLYRLLNNVDFYVLWDVTTDAKITDFKNHIGMLEKARLYFDLICDNVDMTTDLDENITATFYLHN